MENVLIQKIKAHYPDAKIKIGHNREKSLINNFPYKNISVEIKPFNSGLFVFSFHKFEFFDADLLKKYFEKKLNHAKVHKFWATSSRIYVYPKETKDVNSCFDVFQYTTEEIKKIIFDIRKLLSD